MREIFTAAVILAAVCITASAEPARVLDTVPGKVLFIGNSYTFENGGTWNHVRSMAAAGTPAHDIAVSNSMRGGAMFKDHWNLTSSPDSIRKGGWDVVVLQGGTIPTKYLDTCIHYASLLKGLADSVGAQTVMFMTWEHRYITYENMSMGYDSVGNVLGVPVIPVGTAWHLSLARDPDLNLYIADRHHPNDLGTYLSTCVFQAAFTGQSPVGNAYISSTGVSAAQAAYLQGIAWEVMEPYVGMSGGVGDTPVSPDGLQVIFSDDALKVSVPYRQFINMDAYHMDGTRARSLMRGTFDAGPVEIDNGFMQAGQPYIIQTDNMIHRIIKP